MADRRVLLDTGPLVAVFSERDEHHERCVETLKGLTPPLLTCCAVVTEAAWLLRTRPASLNQMYDGFEQGLFALLPIATGDLPAIAAIMRRYHDAGLQFADAAPVHHAESEDIRNVFTVDRRDFSIIPFQAASPSPAHPRRAVGGRSPDPRRMPHGNGCDRCCVCWDEGRPGPPRINQ